MFQCKVLPKSQNCFEITEINLHFPIFQPTDVTRQTRDGESGRRLGHAATFPPETRGHQNQEGVAWKDHVARRRYGTG